MVLFKNALQNAANFIMDGLFPVFCFGCLKNGSYLCEACAKKVPLQNTKKRPLCATSYKNDLATQLIHAFKYEQVKSADKVIAILITRFLRKNHFKFSGDWVLSFVPMHKYKQEIRGYNQSELLAKKLSGLLKLPCRETLL